MESFVEQLKKRRSVYGIAADIPLADDALDEMLRGIIKTVPSAYNMQSQRMVLLLGEKHARLWEIVLESIRVKTGQVTERTQKKIATFAAGHGSILFFDDTATTERFMEENPPYAQNFPPWALQQNGMLQYAVWAALANAGIGASLQHYNPLIDDAVKRDFALPAAWKLWAQMPFGAIAAAPGEKDHLSTDERYRLLR